MKSLYIYISLLFVTSILSAQGSENTLTFNGIDQSVDIGNQVANNCRTIEMWFKPDEDLTSSLNEPKSLVVRDWNNGDAASTDEFGLFFYPAAWGAGGQLGFYRRVGSTSITIYSDSNTWLAGHWYHVSAAIESSAGMKMYINGVLQQSTHSSTEAIGSQSSGSSDNTVIGKWGTFDIRNFSGEIDELRFWETARSQAEVQDNMCKKLAGNETGLKAYYRYDESSGNTLVDSGPNNYDGTMQNMSDANWVYSGAPIGDESVHLYDPSTLAGQSVILNTTSGDNLELSNINSTSDGVHIYRVDMLPNSLLNLNSPITNNYYGVFLTDIAGTYDLDYIHSDYSCGSCNQIFSRNDNSILTWTNANGDYSNCNFELVDESGIGFDYRAEYILDISNVLMGEESYSGCEGDGYNVTVNSVLYNETNPIGSETITSASGCDSIVEINLVFSSETIGEEIHEGCHNDGYFTFVNGTMYNEANPIGTEIMSNVFGCDSTISINLQFGEMQSGEELYEGCENDGYFTIVNGVLYNEFNPTGTELLIATNGCDSIVSINLVFSVEPTGEESYQGCSGDGYSILVNGNSYDEINPTGNEVFTSASGCDSVVFIELIFNTLEPGEEFYEGCSGDGYSVVVNGNTYNESTPDGIETLQTAQGCDSMVNISLIFNQNLVEEINHDGCIGDGYAVVVNGNSYNETMPSGVEVLASTTGCDSTIFISLEFSESLSGFESYSGCLGDNYAVVVNGTIYDQNNPNGVEVLQSQSGCDSIVFVELSYNQSLQGFEMYNGCNDDGYSVVVNGTTYNEANPTGTEFLVTNGGCDSLVSINLQFDSSLLGEEFYAGCTGDGYVVVVDGVEYSESNPSGTETILSTGGCDSIITIDLHFSSLLPTEEIYTGCSGDGYSLVVNGNTYNESNTSGTEILINSSGCDSIIEINFVYNSLFSSEEFYSGCSGDGYTIMVNGIVYDESNSSGTEILESSEGCDSIVAIELEFNSFVHGLESYFGCSGDGYSVLVNGNLYDQNNPTGSEVLIAAGGCDSIVDISLVFNSEINIFENYVGCIGDSYSIVINGTTYDESNPIGTEVIQGSWGCDSIIDINLDFSTALSGQEIYQGCEGDGYSITVNGTLFNEDNPTGSEMLTSAQGCDSIVDILLQFSSEIVVDFQEVVCPDDSFVINGTTYDINNQIGTEIIPAVGADGCDTMILVELFFYNEIDAMIGGESIICEGDSSEISIALFGGTLFNIVVSDGINLFTFNKIESPFTFMVMPDGTTNYEIISVFSADNPCNSNFSPTSISIVVNELEIEAQIETDFSGFGVPCNGGSEGVASAMVLEGNGPYTYDWDNGMSGEFIANLVAGLYVVTITDFNGCTAIDEVFISEPDPIIFEINAITPSCVGEEDGQIVIDNILGGAAPYLYSIEDGDFVDSNSFESLLPGSYLISVQDSNGCEISKIVTVESTLALNLDVGLDQTIDQGENATIEAIFDIPESDIDTFYWITTDPSISCLDCTNPEVSPLVTTTYIAVLIDKYGCMITDEIIIRVEVNKNVYIPSVFSPNGDGTNDVFVIFGEAGTFSVSNLRIYNRWGELVFSQSNIEPNDLSKGWNGRFKNELVNPAVFAYYAEVVFTDGEIKIMAGDITVVR
ncbi:gliding motility-associated C-terminal domain-containing protein [Saprospiraceae bacterium]|nr:gliding motility-associated C-terminal domain-containing protein [Saprospiraceae bacterium]